MLMYLQKFQLIPGYALTPQALNIIVTRYGYSGRIQFDDFVAAAIRLRMLTGIYFII